MPGYRVVAEFIDKETGQRRFPGDVVDITSSARVKTLADIGVIDPEPVETTVQETKTVVEQVETTAQEAAQEDSAEQEGGGQPQVTGEEQPDVVPEEEKPVRAKAKAK